MSSTFGIWLDATRSPFDVYENPKIEFLAGEKEKSKLNVSVKGEKLILNVSGPGPLLVEKMYSTGWKTLSGSSSSSVELSIFGTYRVTGADFSEALILRALRRKLGWQISTFKTEKLRRDLLWGLGLLVLLSLGLTFGLSQNFLKFSREKTEKIATEESEPVPVIETIPEISKETAGIIVSLAEQAFRGKRSYDESATVTDKVSSDLSKIQGLASQLSNLSQRVSSGPGVKIQTGGGAQAVAKGAEALAKATGEMKNQLAQVKSGRVNSAQVDINLKGAGRGFSSEDELKIRKLFDSQNSRMTQVFDRALKVDRTLSVTVNWQATVQKNGRLGDIKFKSTGSYTDAGIEVLEQGLQEILGSLRVDPRAEGILLKGERFFAQ